MPAQRGERVMSRSECLIRSLNATGTRRRALAGLLLGAVQLLGGWDPTGETLARKGKRKKGKKKHGNPPAGNTGVPPAGALPGAEGPPACPGGRACPSGCCPDAAVRIVEFAFTPPTLEVPVGTTVVWTNGGSMTHTVTADGASFDSGSITPGSAFAHTFATPGQYPYHCTPHPFMTAQVRVT
jgi:hypothetical protein